ncbi:hypothetical protein [Streptomyces sp. NBC_00140]|uniref:hypothetical protein n=1 Tax=Streptomyces sp. NBC_00140 TaxID=2975664 RepID=UPI0022523CC1|nr:hypothetical protein [Streptomyces sp. NBC_00140]MCX5336301.1 hypothetical protein [Streptomyces sp. NBC_00140]
MPLGLADAVLATSSWYTTRIARPHCAITTSTPPTYSRGNSLVHLADWKRWTAEQRTDAPYGFALGAGCTVKGPHIAYFDYGRG